MAGGARQRVRGQVGRWAIYDVLYDFVVSSFPCSCLLLPEFLGGEYEDLRFRLLPGRGP